MGPLIHYISGSWILQSGAQTLPGGAKFSQKPVADPEGPRGPCPPPVL